MPEITILSLPLAVLSQILSLESSSREGKIFFDSHPWTLPLVHPYFRDAFYAAITRVTLSDALSIPSPSAAHFAALPRAILLGPLRHCGRLADLDLTSCDALCDDDIAAFASHPALTALTISICLSQTDASTLALARASPSLRHAAISGCDRHRHAAVVDASPEEASWAVTRRHVPCAALTNVSLLALATYTPLLSSLTLSNAPYVTDTALRALSALTNLAHVTLRRLPGVTAAGLAHFLSSPSRLTSLSLLSSPSLGDETLRAVATSPATSSTLAFFALTFSFAASDAGVAALLAIPTLTELQIDHCADVSDAWASSAGRIERLSLRSVPLVVSDASFDSLSSLTALNLGFVASVGAAMLRGVRAAAPALQVLVLDACGGVDDEALGECGQFERLDVLDVSWCGGVSAQGVRALAGSAAGRRLTRLSLGPVCKDEDAADAVDGAAVAGAGAGGGEGGNGDDEAPAGPLLADYYGVDAAEVANALDLVVHEEDVEPDMAFMAALSAAAASHSPSHPAHGEEEEEASPQQAEIDAALRTVGRKCTQLIELNLCGAISWSTVAWLRRNTQARIEYADVADGIRSGLYDSDG